MQKLDPALRGGPTIQYRVHLEAPQKISGTRDSVSFFFFSFLLLGFFTWKIKHGFGGGLYNYCHVVAGNKKGREKVGC